MGEFAGEISPFVAGSNLSFHSLGTRFEKRFNYLAIHILPGVDMRGVVFSEWVPAGSFIKAILGFVFLVILCVLSITVVTGVAFQNPFWLAVSGSTIAFLLFLFWNYRGIRVQLSEVELLVNYGVFNRTCVPLANIVSCETVKASFWKYGGVGVRFGTDGSWAYTTSFGNAVKVTRKKGRPFVFSSSSPQKICNIINQMKDQLA